MCLLYHLECKYNQDLFSLYYQKYIEITTRSDGYTDNPFGFYPDILLPYEKAVEYKENTIEALTLIVDSLRDDYKMK